MNVYIDENGRYYQADAPKSTSDAKIENPSQDMLAILTDKPMTVPDFHAEVLVQSVELLPQQGEVTDEKAS